MSDLPRIRPDRFHDFVRLASGLAVADADERGYGDLFDHVGARLTEGDGAALLAHLPAWIGERFAARGWAWNGYYRSGPGGDALELGHAFGPPVCTPIPRAADGGVTTSGMCWDAMISNQCLLATDVGAWPGYVSCDGTSGLHTAAGLVCPIRNPTGRPIGVWDLDCSGPLDAVDARAMDALFSTLSLVLSIESTDLGA